MKEEEVKLEQNTLMNIFDETSYRHSLIPKFEALDMPSFDQKVPSSWQTLNDEYMFFNIVNSPYIHRKVLPHPMVRMNDGTSDLVI